MAKTSNKNDRSLERCHYPHTADMPPERTRGPQPRTVPRHTASIGGEGWGRDIGRTVEVCAGQRKGLRRATARPPPAMSDLAVAGEQYGRRFLQRAAHALDQRPELVVYMPRAS